MTDNLPKILLVGRANVGKSTLFNRLVGIGSHRKQRKTQAIVSARAGATRDLISAPVKWWDLRFTLVDGAGWSERPASELQKKIAEHSRKSLEAVDIILFIYDGKAGILPEDKALADFFRKLSKPIIAVANKCEGGEAVAGLGEAYSLGIGEPVAMSALHGEGIDNLYEVLEGMISPMDEVMEESPKIRMCILGRPNVGKSTFVNRLLGEDKALVADMPGLTRDSVEYPLRHGDEDFLLIDTAGMRRKSKVHEDLEKLSITGTLKALQYSDVAVLVIDASEELEKQDLTLARMIADEGRAPVILLNKWDLVKDKKVKLKAISEWLEDGFSQVKGVRVVPLSALKSKNVGGFWKSVSESYAAWNKRVSTGLLNRWLDDCVSENPPPIASGRRLKIRYITQVKTRPPTFVVFASQSGKGRGDGALPVQYMRFLRNRLVRDFDIVGVPLRLLDS